jgi:hypothetical protein
MLRHRAQFSQEHRGNLRLTFRAVEFLVHETLDDSDGVIQGVMTIQYGATST